MSHFPEDSHRSVTSLTRGYEIAAKYKVFDLPDSCWDSIKSRRARPHKLIFNQTKSRNVY